MRSSRLARPLNAHHLLARKRVVCLTIVAIKVVETTFLLQLADRAPSTRQISLVLYSAMYWKVGRKREMLTFRTGEIHPTQPSKLFYIWPSMEVACRSILIISPIKLLVERNVSASSKLE